MVKPFYISNTYPYGKSYGANATYDRTDDYRYGFNGMEKEKNISPSGNTFDFGARVYDSEFPTFLSRDPLEGILVGQSSYIFAASNPISYIDIKGTQPGKVNKGVDFLIVGIQGYVTNSPKKNKTQTKNDNRFTTEYDGVASFMLLDQNEISGLKNVQAFVYATSGIFDNNGYTNTQNDIIKTVRDYKNKNPNGKIIFVGHSEGAQQLVDLAYEISDISIDYSILIDIQANNEISGTTAQHTAPNMKETINYYVDGGTSYGGILRKYIAGYEKPIGGNILKPLFKNTSINNVPINGFDHRSIDQGISKKVLNNIENYIEKSNKNKDKKTK